MCKDLFANEVVQELRRSRQTNQTLAAENTDLKSALSINDRAVREIFNELHTAFRHPNEDDGEAANGDKSAFVS